MFTSVVKNGVIGRLAAVCLLAVLSACAGAPSSRYDGDYRLSSTPAAGYEQSCPTDELKVTVSGGRLDFSVHPPDTWHGYVDDNGYFHGESAYGARDFKLTEGMGVMAPGQVGSGIDQSCHYDYRFRRIGTEADAHR